MLHLGTPIDLPRSFDRSSSPVTTTQNGLESLSITVATEDAATLKQVRDHGLQTGVIRRGEVANNGLVPVTITFRGQPYTAQARIKGDWADHINTDKWSFRLELNDGAMMGMREFSIQHPQTRNYLRGWIFRSALRREGLIAPRDSFINVSINGNEMGVYNLEEHLSTHMLESQGRREGPIVKFDDDNAWLARLDFSMIHRAGLPLLLDPYNDADKAKVSAFDVRRLIGRDVLARQLDHAMGQLRDYQRLLVTLSDDRDQMTALLARAALQEKTVETIFDVEEHAAAHALCSVLANSHPLTWENLRFYHNPITGKLEPLAFEIDAGYVADRDPVIWEEALICRLMVKNAGYNEAFFRYLARYCEPDYLDGLFADLGPELRRYEQALQSGGLLPDYDTIPQMVSYFGRRQQHLRELLVPRATVSFAAILHERRATDQDNSNVPIIEVEAWADTSIPFVIDGFRLNNGHYVPAFPYLVNRHRQLRVPNAGGVIVPIDGSRANFRLPADMFNAEVTQTGRNQLDVVPGRPQSVAVLWRSASDTNLRERMLLPGCTDNAGQTDGRPQAPSLHDALEQYPMLSYDIEGDRLAVRGGTWTFDRDFHLPAGHVLQVGPATTLQFSGGAALITNAPLIFVGTQDEPIILQPADGHERWSGVAVIEAAGQSRWEHVIVQRAHPIERGTWGLAGGITFYKSPVHLDHVRIESSYGKHALKIFAADFQMRSVEIVSAQSDMFDGEFVYGTIQDCDFHRCGRDAISLTGSDVKIENCRFGVIGDTCLSAGANSMVRMQNVVAEQAGIGVAANDLSTVEIETFRLSIATSYGVVVNAKEPEHGPSTVRIRDLDLGECGEDQFLVKRKSVLIIDGVQQAAQSVDGDDRYER